MRPNAITSNLNLNLNWLSEYALSKNVRWSMHSNQGAGHIKTRLGNDPRQPKIIKYKN
jgi:hypothetical protein